jgi:uncharacterized membrane protein
LVRKYNRLNGLASVFPIRYLLAMDITVLLSLFSPPDFAALALLVAAWACLGWIIEHPPARYPSVTVLTSQYRREWMAQMITRDPRMFDAVTLDGLRQAIAFFASGCMLAIGGVMASVNNTEDLAMVASDLSASAQSTLVWRIKFLVVALLLTHAFLKFVWSNRLFGYCAVTMAATPNDPTDPLAQVRAEQAAVINIRAALSFNRGLRSIYFALAALAWLLGPWALIAATVLTGFTLLSREFTSTSRNVLMKKIP